MRRRSRPVIYLRVAEGGRRAAEEQEREVRAALAAVGVDSQLMHVSCDIDVRGLALGPALLSLVEEASFGQVDTVIVRDVSRLGSGHNALVAALLSLDHAGVEVLVAEALPLDRAACERLRSPDSPQVYAADVGVGGRAERVGLHHPAHMPERVAR